MICSFPPVCCVLICFLCLSVLFNVLCSDLEGPLCNVPESRYSTGRVLSSWLQILISQFSCSVVSDSLRPHESQHARPPCPSLTPGVHSDSRPSSRWWHPATSSHFFGAPKNKIWYCFPSISHEVMGPDAMIFVFWMLSFKPLFHSALSLSRGFWVPLHFLP